jgi:hypothetical protein
VNEVKAGANLLVEMCVCEWVCVFGVPAHKCVTPPSAHTPALPPMPRCVPRAEHQPTQTLSEKGRFVSDQMRVRKACCGIPKHSKKNPEVRGAPTVTRQG